MSNSIFSPDAILTYILALMAGFYWRKSKTLREGQQNWRAVALGNGKELESLKASYANAATKMTVITKAFEGLSVQYREREQRLNSASAEAAERAKELAIVSGALVRTQEALHQVTTDPQALQRFQEGREKFMREIEGLAS